MRILPEEWRILEMMTEDPEATRWMTVESIAEYLGREPIEVRVWVESLERQSLLVSDFHPNGCPNKYYAVQMVRYDEAEKRCLREQHHRVGPITYMGMDKEESDAPTTRLSAPLGWEKAAKAAALQESASRPEPPAPKVSKAQAVQAALEIIESRGFPLDAVVMGEQLENPISLAGEILCQIQKVQEDGALMLFRVIWENEEKLRCDITWWEAVL